MSLRRMTVSDLMTTALVVLREQDTVEQADFEMRLTHIRHIPVVSEHRHLMGIVSNRDLLKAIGEKKLAAALRTVMSRGVITVRPTTPAHVAAELMLSHKIGALPVVDEREELVGIVTETDFLKVAAEALAGRKVG